MTIFPWECLSNNKCMDVFLERFLRVHQMVGSTKCYMKNSLICIDNLLSIQPVLLTEDGHSSHISISAIEKAHECDISISCLPAHTTATLRCRCAYEF